MSTRNELEARFKAFLDENYPCCGVPGCCGEEEEAKALVDIAYEMMRPLTLVEIAARERPEQMEAAREKVRAARRESQSEMIREAKAFGFESGFTACANEHMKQMEDPTHPITRINPFGETFADRMARKSLEAKAAKHQHPAHKEGQWYYACEACSGLPDGDRQ